MGVMKQIYTDKSKNPYGNFICLRCYRVQEVLKRLFTIKGCPHPVCQHCGGMLKRMK